MRVWFRFLLAGAVLLAGCTSGGDEDAGPASSTTGAPGPSTSGPPAGDGAPECEASEFDVTYPPGWWTNEANVEEQVAACSFFHPEPVELEYGTEVPGLAIDLGVDGLWAEMRQIESGQTEILSERSTTVGGREAIRYEIRSREEGIYPAGTVSTVWIVNLEPLGLVATTSDYGDLNYEENRQVLDRMVESLEFPEAPRCSAAGMKPGLPAQEIPDAVAATRRAVAEAAAACDYARLDGLAGPGFSFGFGGRPGPPSQSWRRDEASGAQPMRFLVGLLDRPVGRVRGAAPPVYAWPSAFTFESWGAVPAADREALRPLYGDDDFEDFARFGSYVGYRAGINESGDWMYYLAGD